MDRAERSWAAQVTKTRVSGLQAAVHAEVCRLGLECELEGKTRDGLFSVDVMVETPTGEQVAVEVDGPTHFTRNEPYRELGKTRLRRRLLEARVSRVVSVPFCLWNALEGAEQRQSLVRRLVLGD